MFRVSYSRYVSVQRLARRVLDVDGKFVTFISRCAKRPQYGSGKDRVEARVRIEQRQVDPALGIHTNRFLLSSQ